MVGTDGNTCANIDSVMVTVFSIPSISDAVICIGDELQLVASGPSNANYSWSPVANLSDPNIFNPITNTLVTVTYIVTVQDVNGCLASESVLVTAETKPTVSFLMDLTPSCDGVLAEFTSLSTGADGYLWSFGDGSQSTEINPIHLFQYGGSFLTTLTVASTNSCSSSSDSIVTTNSFESQFNIEAPSVFSPNHDGINDLFQLDITGEMAKCINLYIYNRWGSKIFQSEGQNIGWDGRTTAGVEVPAGTYFYILEINGITKKGSLTLLD